jgi:hypothetical protein
MTERTLYKSVKSVAVRSRSHTELQDQTVGTPHLPFQEEVKTLFSRVSIPQEENEYIPDEGVQLVQISALHQRSYEIRFGMADAVIWNDEYGNIFSSITTKGSNLSEPNIYKYEDGSHYYFGLQESKSMTRILRASEVMRSEHIDTEIITHVLQPEELPINQEIQPYDYFFRELFEKITDENGMTEGEKDEGKVQRSEIPEVSKQLDEKTFFITLRGMLISERVEDLLQVKDIDDLSEMMTKVFRVVNVYERIKKRKDPTYDHQQFDPVNQEDLYRYLTTYLAHNAATNYAKLHNKGLVHKYSNIRNVTLIGGICDLDSVTGEPLELGDPAITSLKARKDIHMFLHDENNSGGVEAALLSLQWDHYLGRDRVTQDDFRYNFLTRYITLRGWDQDIPAHVSEISELCKFFGDPADDRLIPVYLNGLSEVSGIPDTFELDDDDVVSGVSKIHKEQFLKHMEHFFDNLIHLAASDEISEERIMDFFKDGPGLGSIIWDYTHNLVTLQGMEAMQNQYPEQIETFSQRYGAENAQALTKVLAEKAFRHYEAIQSPDIIQKIRHEMTHEYFTEGEFKPYRIEDMTSLLTTLKDRQQGNRTDRILDKTRYVTVGGLPLKDMLFALSVSNNAVEIALQAHEKLGTDLLTCALENERYLFSDGIFERPGFPQNYADDLVAELEISGAHYIFCVNKKMEEQGAAFEYGLISDMSRQELEHVIETTGIENITLTK